MRVLAIGDIHGCLGPLDDLLDWVKPEPDDVLITLGDYVAANANAIGFYEALGARRMGLKRMGEGADAWDEILFALATDAPAAFRRG